MPQECEAAGQVHSQVTPAIAQLVFLFLKPV